MFISQQRPTPDIKTGAGFFNPTPLVAGGGLEITSQYNAYQQFK